MNPYLIYEITARCNSNCLYCYNVWKQKRSYPQEELSLPEIKKLFTKLLAESNFSGITLAGGEPLLHPDILAVAAFLSSKNIKVGLASNGTLPEETTIRQLIDAGVKYFEISLPGIREKTYQMLTGSAQLTKVRRAILKIKKYKAQLTVTTVITKLNLADFDEILELCIAFSVDNLALNRFVPGGTGLKHLADLSLSNEELTAILLRANEQSQKCNFPINITIPVESCVIEHSKYPYLNFGACVCGKIKWVIDPLGNLRICEQNPAIIGNLFQRSFNELRQSSVVKHFQNNNLKSNCHKCDQYKSCGGGCRFLRTS